MALGDRSSALPGVDLQNSLMPGGNLAVRRGDEVVPTINALSALDGDRFALLEFVRNDDPDQFLADAGTLKRLLQSQESGSLNR
jgi:hypothetical protein